MDNADTISRESLRLACLASSADLDTFRRSLLSTTCNSFETNIEQTLPDVTKQIGVLDFSSFYCFRFLLGNVGKICWICL
jgi:hypothetical protein